MRRRTFLATALTATTATLAGCTEDEYEASTDVVNTYERNDTYYATIRVTLHNNTDFNETLQARLKMEWQHIETEETVVADVDADSTATESLDASGPSEYDDHSVDVRRL